jgi:ketosteroid isomerase-like protein
MTATDTSQPTAGGADAATAQAQVESFFDAYREHDVETMVDLCDDMAEFHYVPVEIWGKQRVIRGDGKVRTVGKVLWTGLIDAVPNLTNEVTSISADGDGNVAAEVVIGGTQSKDWGPIGTQGRHYDLPHLFLFHVNGDGLIDRITAYWDGADFNQQLGRLEVD